MSTILFPAGLTVDFRDMSLEKMEFYSRAWNLQRVQMQKGLFIGSIITTHTPRMQLMRAPYSHGILLKGDFPKGTILIVCAVTQADMTFQNKIADKHEIKILKSGDEIDFISNGEIETFSIVIEEKFFYEAYDAYFGQDFNRYKKDKKIYVDPQSYPQFIRGFKQWMNYLMQDHNKLQIEKQYDKIESEILEHLFSYIHLDDAKKLRQKFQIKKARDLIDQSIQNPLSIGDLAQDLKVSERLLHHAFKANYGITPKQYMLSLRMHNVKQELLSADPSKTSISEIIEKYKFFNQSTFSQAYKQMFVELPSDVFKSSH